MLSLPRMVSPVNEAPHGVKPDTENFLSTLLLLTAKATCYAELIGVTLRVGQLVRQFKVRQYQPAGLFLTSETGGQLPALLLGGRYNPIHSICCGSMPNRHGFWRKNKQSATG